MSAGPEGHERLGSGPINRIWGKPLCSLGSIRPRKGRDVTLESAAMN